MTKEDYKNTLMRTNNSKDGLKIVQFYAGLGFSNIWNGNARVGYYYGANDKSVVCKDVNQTHGFRIIEKPYNWDTYSIF